MKFGSPYTPGAGAMPPYLAGRDNLIEDAQKALLALTKGYPQKPVIYYGLRGVGKTVLLNAVEEKADDLDLIYTHIEIAEKRSFTKQIFSYSRQMIHKMSKAAAAKDMVQKALEMLRSISVTYSPEDQSFSVEMGDIPAYVATGSFSDDLTDLFVTMGKTAQKANQSICIFIDEIQYMKDREMEAMINALHRVNQLRLPILMFGAGLPKVLRIFGEVKSYTERLFDFIPIDKLLDTDARKAIIEPAADLDTQYTEEAICEILKLSQGYPYFIQELCDCVWKYTDKNVIEKEDVSRTIPTFLNKLDEGFFKVRYERCTKKEHDFLFAMVRCGELPCTISNVASILKKNVSAISPIRAKLISKGIIYSTGHGEIDFTVPLFDEYLKRINPSLKFDSEIK